MGAIKSVHGGFRYALPTLQQSLLITPLYNNLLLLLNHLDKKLIKTRGYF
jgi:hypothetical protein